jgi:hypothetical protein
MFLKSITELAVDFEDVQAVMLRDPQEWLAGLAAKARDHGDLLVVNVGLEVAGQQVGGGAQVEIGEPMTSQRVLMLPLRLRARDHRGLFPTLEGSLDAAWLGRHRTYLASSFQYEPPLGLVGRAVDRALLHRVAEAVAQRFLESVANDLRARADRPLDGVSRGDARFTSYLPL